MKHIFFLSFLCICVYSTQMYSQHEYVRTVNKSLNVSQNPVVSVEGEFGPINVTGTKSAKAEIIVKIVAKDQSKEKAQKLAEEGVKVRIDATNDAISIVTDLRRKTHSGSSIAISTTVKIPERSELKVYNSFGEIKINAIKGNVKVRGKHGDVEVTDAGNVGVQNQFGAISLASLKGKVVVHGKHGGIQCHSFQGGEITNEFGSVSVSNSKEFVSIRSKMGAINAVKINSARIKNEYGNIEVQLLPTFKGKVEARTQFGSIENNFDVPIEEKLTSARMRGSIGTGSSTLNVENKFGSISITK